MERKVGAFQRMKATFQHIRIFMDWLNARIMTSKDFFRIKTPEKFLSNFFRYFDSKRIRSRYEEVIDPSSSHTTPRE